MEFDFTSLCFGGEQHIVSWDAKRIGALKPDDQKNLGHLLDVFGKKSAFAQGLQTPITDIHRLRTTDQRLYLYMYRQSSKTVVLGGLKVGTKRLYVRTVTAELKEIEPICVLDFYVHESCQRQGVGKALFEHFLNAEGCDPASLAYDRPSPKLMSFLRKHYGLTEYVPQSNNYVIFNRYFELNPGPGVSRGSGQGRLSSRGSSGSMGTPHIHPLHGPRSTPPLASQLTPSGAPPPIHPAWAGGSSSLSAPTPSAVGPPAPLGNSPSFGRRWAANNFAYITGTSAQDDAGGSGGGATTASSGGGFGEYGGSMGGADTGAEPGYGRDGDALDAFSRAHHSGVLPSQTSHPQPPQYQLPPRAPAPWEGPPASSGHPPASRSGYVSRPPWAVDDGQGSGAGPSGISGQGQVQGQGLYPAPAARTPSLERLSTGSHAAARGPLQVILGGGANGGGGGGPHTRALQQQVAAMDGSAGGLGYLSAQPGQWASGTSTPASGARPSEEGGARGAAKIVAVAQRSGAGAADCLVW